MATVQLSDIIDTTVFQDIPAVNSPEKTAFFEAGAAVRNGMLDNIASQPGSIAELPFWKDLDASSDPNLSSDDPAVDGTPEKIVQGEQIGRTAYLNKGWSESDLASEIVMGPKAMDQIRARVDTYWMRSWQRRLIATYSGILADNIANDDGDMVADVSEALTADVTASSVFSRQAFTSAAFTLGDHVDDINVISVHSVVYKRMMDNDDIDFIPDSQGQMTIPTFLGKRVVVDDGMTFTPGDGTNAPTYTSILWGAGAVGYGMGNPKVPVEVERAERGGNGAGVETLWTRKTWLVHPFGFQTGTAPAGPSYSVAELGQAATWDRVVDRKNVPVSFLITNG